MTRRWSTTNKAWGTTWTISFKAIKAKSESAANLLCVWAFLGNQDLWHGLLQAASDDGQWPGWLSEMADNKVEFVHAVQLLRRYSMVEVQESVQGSYMMHPVAHKWTAHIQDGDEKRNFLQLAIVIVGSMVPSSTTKDYWVLQRRLLLHAEQCSWWIGEIDKANEGGRSFVDISVAGAMHNLAILYLDQDRLAEAEALYERALQGREKALEPDHTSTLQTIHNLAILYSDQGRLAEAEALYERALQGLEKALGPDHTSTLQTIHNLAILYSDQGRLAEAETLYERAAGLSAGFGTVSPEMPSGPMELTVSPADTRYSATQLLKTIYLSLIRPC